MRLEKRILGDLLGDIGFELEVAELEELDRLGELRGENQLLGLAKVEARAEPHRIRRYSAKLSPR
jgi:hypothetical protein